MPTITTTEDIFGSKPHIVGTRIAVHQIWQAVHRDNFFPEEVAEELYPQLDIEEVHEALEFAEENLGDEFWDQLNEEESDLREMERNSKSQLESNRGSHLA